MTVVVVAWRSAATIDACLASVLEAADADRARVLVVDNDSDQATRERLAAWADRIEVLPQGVNRGFAGGVAVAVPEVHTPYVLLLNDDAVMTPGSMARLRTVMEQRADGTRLAAVQPAIQLAATDPALTNSTGNMVTPDGYGYDRDWLAPWPPQRPADDEPFGFCGAAALLDVAAVRSVGGMDASLFLYYEDTDLSWRLRLNGWTVAYCPEAVVRHAHGSSSGEGSNLFRFHNERNRLLVLARDAPAGMALRQWLRFPLTTLSLAVRVGPRRSQTVVRLRALAGAFGRLPSTLRKRARDRTVVGRSVVQRRLTAPDRDLGAYRGTR